MNADCIPEPGYERDLPGTFLVEKAIDFLKQPCNQPFALWVSLSEPHAPFAFPVEDRDLYRADQFQHPPVGANDWESVPAHLSRTH
jgi:phosphoglycerol transferase MdoB-like AlkP superfamily enzyme